MHNVCFPFILLLPGDCFVSHGENLGKGSVVSLVLNDQRFDSVCDTQVSYTLSSYYMTSEMLPRSRVPLGKGEHDTGKGRESEESAMHGSRAWAPDLEFSQGSTRFYFGSWHTEMTNGDNFFPSLYWEWEFHTSIILKTWASVTFFSWHIYLAGRSPHRQSVPLLILSTSSKQKGRNNMSRLDFVTELFCFVLKMTTFTRLLTSNWPSCALAAYVFQNHEGSCQSSRCQCHRWSISSMKTNKRKPPSYA